MSGSDKITDLDPLDFYVKRARKLELEAQGVERLAYRIFGADNIGSITFAIDPLRPFRRVGQQAVPVNRTRKFTAHGTPNTTKVRLIKRSILGESPPDTSTADPFDRLPYSESCTVTTSTLAGVNQQLINGEVKDTTYRTRPFGNDEGEFELWNPRVYAKGTSRVSIDDSDNWAEPNNYRYRTADVEDSSHIGPCATVSASTVNNLRSGMQTYLLSLMGSNTIKLVNAVNPSKREFALAYSVGELKDLPRSIETGLRTLVQARRLAMGRVKGLEAKQAAAEFVSFEFGWKQMYKDIDRFINFPERLAKKVNFLMRRNGKLTTLRAGRLFEPRTVAVPPSFVHTLLTKEVSKGITNSALIRDELKLVVRTLIDFPRLEVPEVRKSFVYEQLGVSPTPEDVYNLIPWTWLNDWFTGLGDYVNCYDRVNLDPQLVDVGFITGISTLHASSLLVTERQTIRQRAITPPVPPVYYQDVNPNRRSREARLEAKLQIRRSLTSAYGVKPAWELTALSGFQLSILGALGLIRAHRTP